MKRDDNLRRIRNYVEVDIYNRAIDRVMVKCPACGKGLANMPTVHRKRIEKAMAQYRDVVPITLRIWLRRLAAINRETQALYNELGRVSQSAQKEYRRLNEKGMEAAVLATEVHNGSKP